MESQGVVLIIMMTMCIDVLNVYVEWSEKSFYEIGNR